MLWNAMLCQTYYTVSSKSRRERFAHLVTDARENGCKTANEPDGKAMDVHNNAVGRKVWSDNCGYRKFLGWVVGLRKPSITFLTNEIKNVIESKSCFIVKKKDDRFPNSELIDTQTPAQIKAKIESTDPNIPIYFMGTIAPSRYEYRFVFSHWEYYNCDAAKAAKLLTEEKECKRAIYSRERVEIAPCFKL